MISSSGSTVSAPTRAVSAAPLVRLEILMIFISLPKSDFNLEFKWCFFWTIKIKSLGVRLKGARESIAQEIMGLPRTFIKGLGCLYSGFR